MSVWALSAVGTEWLAAWEKELRTLCSIWRKSDHETTAQGHPVCCGSAAAADENDAQVEAHHPLDTTLDYTTALGIVSCAGLVNDSWAEGILYFPFDHSDSTPEIQVRTVATGAGTLDVTIEIIGYIT